MNVDLLRAPQFRAARALTGFSREEIAKRCDVSVATIAKIETDPSDVKLSVLERVHVVFSFAGVTFVRDAGRIGVLLRQ
jgi:transcriptional regulator with XRE-family HTH domain